MNWKKIGKALLFPHMAVLLILLPASAALLVYSMVFLGTETPMAYAAYGLSAYTLTIWVCRVPALIRFFKTFQAENKLVRRWTEDIHWRVNVTLGCSSLWNAVYGVFQLGLGVVHQSFWFYSLGGYYLSLAVMRFFLVRYTRAHLPGENIRQELVRYRTCGIFFLVLNLTLSVMIFFMVYWNRTFHHHEITTIAMAAYTFGSLSMAIWNVVKFRKYRNPVYSASKSISLAAACVSLLTLEATMLTTFGEGTMTPFLRRMFLSVSGGVLSLFITGMAVYMIVHGNNQLKLLKTQKEQIYGE